jgi:hypothetical protein
MLDLYLTPAALRLAPLSMHGEGVGGEVIEQGNAN